MAMVNNVAKNQRFHYHNPVKSKREIADAHKLYKCKRYAVDCREELAKIADIVGPMGRVYASDIQQEMLDIIKAKMGSAPLKNVTLVLGEDDNPKLPAGEIDTVLMVDVYHELHRPQAVLKNIRAALKPGGRLVLVEYREEDPNVPIQRLHKMSVKTAKLEVEHEGFTLSKVVSDLPWQHLLVFTKE